MKMFPADIWEYPIPKIGNFSFRFLGKTLDEIHTSIPSVPTIRHICEAMGITISQFYSTDGSAATITEQQKAFLELFDRLSPGDKKKAEGYIEGLLAKSQSEP